MRKLLLLVCMCLCIVQSWAQNRTVTGKVLNEKGEAIPGASVKSVGGKGGTVTAEDGTFSLQIAASVKSVEVSAVGYVMQNISIGTGQNLQMVLNSAVGDLGTVTVSVGYGTKTVKEVTGALAKVSGSILSNEPGQGFNQAMAGKMAGVQIGTSSGTLGDRTAVRVRGINSISSSSQPLIVVDGVPQMDVGNLNGFNSGNGTRFDPLSMINSSDIESVEVLKDAGAAVIYGSRAANGVILITTKQGKKGNIKVELQSKIGFSSARKLPSLLNAEQFTSITNEKFGNRYGTTATSGYPFARTSDINQDGVTDNTNWLKEIYRTGMMYDNSVSFTGGAEKMSVYGSVRYLKQEGILTANQLKTGQARLNMTVAPKSWFKAGMQLSYSKTLNNGALTDGYISGASVSGWQAPPNVSAFNPNGPAGFNVNSRGLIDLGNNITTAKVGSSNVALLPSSSYYVNIPAALALNRNNNTAQDLKANIYGEIQPLKGLKYTSKFGIQYLSNFEDQYSSPFISGLGLTYGGLVQDQTSSWSQWVWQNYISYDFSINRIHKISAVAGMEDQYTSFQQIYTGAGNFVDPYFKDIIDGTYTNTIPGSTDIQNNTGGDKYSTGLMSFFGRVSYSFTNKLFAELAVRRDGYSAFGTNNQFATFPSISLGWELTKEQFMKTLPWIEYLKLRGSYGVVGNSAGIKPYASRTLYAGANYTSINGFAVSQMGNADLQWESSKKTGFGFDATFLKKRLNVTVDYFNNNIDHLLLQAPAIYTVGIPNASIYSNIGAMYNRGLEITINATPITAKNFTWNTSFNFTTIKNRVTALIPQTNNADIAGAYAYTIASVGRPLGSFYLPEWAGVDAATGNPMWRAKTGGFKIWDFNSQGWIDDKGAKTSALGISDYNYTGKSGLPTWYGGWDNTLQYKNIDLGVNMNFAGGNYIYNASKAGMLTNAFSNNYTDILSRWQKPGDKTDMPRLYGKDDAANAVSTRFLEKGDYLRVRTITLGYNFSKELLGKIGIDRIRIYAQLFNPFVVTKYSGLDPDVNYVSQSSAKNSSNITLGVDNRATPQSKMFMFGLNAGF